ncbi:hypothetical protein [Flammeovirga kamogawensis]|uniref:Outer membrane beta-barrel protein n=1 Tax=Flammeovirga kamogawensis TaxID=373891 RepID=A0ABX8H402_9BACT|nr:hypothetical protein [Flammeovirga kamogawensis]MBB6461856.1 hypothetical protein [Flammeovirga kamogawensis]QWG10530.1 hypothetical protein KM029_26515 [Flammeovirga kamogawensis]TRX63639.1 hypothetical protein EO216_24790 [Flammeovirga kamogawensis]
MKKYKLLLIVIIEFSCIRSNAQDLALHSQNSQRLIIGSREDSSKSKNTKYFIAYDFGEAAFNKFKSLGSEIGVRFKNDHLLRLAYTNLHLSEEHLSSNFAKAVDGEKVKGKQVGYEVFYDFPVFAKGLYVSPSMGYYTHEYQHTQLDEQLNNSSFTFGSAISYTETDLFKIKGLYYRFSIPLRFHLTPIEETQLGDTTINSNTFDNSICFFIGYEF